MEPKIRTFTILITAVVLTAMHLPATAAAQIQAPQQAITLVSNENPDFNGDGYRDLVIAATGEEINDATNAGAVTVLYGNPEGTVDLSTYLHQDIIGVPGESKRGDQFGFATSSTDFNRDGYSDLIIASPFKDAENIKDSGAIWIFFGGTGGIDFNLDSAELLHQGTTGILGTPEESDLWGLTIETGDFDADGYGDIVIGVPGKNIKGRTNAGEITVLYGDESRNPTSRVETINQSNHRVPDAAETGDRWGAALTSGDFNGDGFTDLAVGAPGERYGTYENAGAITILYGSKQGLTSTKSTRFHQDTPEIPDRNETNDHWGSNLESGDFNNDGYDDVIIGTPNESSGDRKESGTLTVLPGSPSGPTSKNAMFLHKGSFNVPGNISPYDRWGSVLVSSDFNNDGYTDIIVGTPDETVGPAQKSGAITILKGGSRGLSGFGSYTLDQTSPGIGLITENADHWADSLAALDFNGDGNTDLAVSATTESTGTHFDSGAVSLIWGTKDGLIGVDSITLTQDSINVPGENKSKDFWGRLGTTGLLSPQRPQSALRTPSGVNVSLLTQKGDDFIVRTPCGHAVVVTGGEILENIEIVIDPGHGGVDVGAVHHGLIEKKLNLMIAEELVKELTLRGVNAILTRTGNYHMPLSSRGQFADHLNAAAMISIHHNAPAGARSFRPGVETFVQTGSPLSEYLGELVYGNAFNALQQFTWVSWTSAADAGVIRVLNTQGKDTYGMMSRPKTPTTLIELAYIANPSEAALVKTNSYLSAVVEALADASESFLANSHIQQDTSSTVRRYTAGEAPGYDVCFDPLLQSWADVISKAIQKAIDEGILPDE